MPEVVCAISKHNTLEELEAELQECNFMKLRPEDVDHPVRRMADRAIAGREQPVKQMELVKALRSGSDHIPPNVSYGTMSNRAGQREYVGVHRKGLYVVWVNHDWVERRRKRYTAMPMPSDVEGRAELTKNLMTEIIDKWSGENPDTMGASYAQIYFHVADYANLTVKEARKLVDEHLPQLPFVEKSEGDHYRIVPSLFGKPKILIDVT